MAEVFSPLGNRLLASLPQSVGRSLSQQMTLMDLPLGAVLAEAGETIRYAYFPVDAIVSLLYVMQNGAPAEIAVVGNEGLVGIAIFMGGQSTTNRAVVQSAGTFYRMPADILQREFQRSSELRLLLMRYTQALLTQMAQTAACNRHHSIDQQLCRWLLLSLDCLPGNCLNMTQELIANMLGVRREGVTDAAGKLQAMGAIQYSRGRITVNDRTLLEKLSCECYSVVRRETERLLQYLVTEH